MHPLLASGAQIPGGRLDAAVAVGEHQPVHQVDQAAGIAPSATGVHGVNPRRNSASQV